MQFNHSFKFTDLIIIASILIVAILSYGIVNLTSGKSSDDSIVVHQYGELILQLTQEQLNKDGIYEFQFDKGIGQIEVKDNKVRVLPMAKIICPNGICSDTGWIDGKPKTIVCMPNLLIVSYQSNKDPEIDAIV